jgi:hypothetical protein
MVEVAKNGVFMRRTGFPEANVREMSGADNGSTFYPALLSSAVQGWTRGA